MKKILYPVVLLISTSAAYSNDSLSLEQRIETYKQNKALSQISFNYGLTYLGPSLSQDYQDGATYNRFNSGQDYKGDDVDSTGSQQLYHSFSLGYQATKNVKLSYSYTFQDDYNKGIKYETYNSDGSVFSVNERESGLSYNNQRLNAFVTNIYSNNYFFLMSNFFYEMPTTDGSKEDEMLFGLGIQPTIGIYTPITGLYSGIKASVQRDFYKQRDYVYQEPFIGTDGNTYTGTYRNRHQVLKASITGYLGYSINDKTTVQGSVIFDWDQVGDDIDKGIYNKNMDDVLEIDTSYRVSKQINFGGVVQQSINEVTAKKSAVKAYMRLSI